MPSSMIRPRVGAEHAVADRGPASGRRSGSGRAARGRRPRPAPRRGACRASRRRSRPSAVVDVAAPRRPGRRRSAGAARRRSTSSSRRASSWRKWSAVRLHGSCGRPASRPSATGAHGGRAVVVADRGLARARSRGVEPDRVAMAEPALAGAHRHGRVALGELDRVEALGDRALHVLLGHVLAEADEAASLRRRRRSSAAGTAAGGTSPATEPTASTRPAGRRGRRRRGRRRTRPGRPPGRAASRRAGGRPRRRAGRTSIGRPSTVTRPAAVRAASARDPARRPLAQVDDLARRSTPASPELLGRPEARGRRRRRRPRARPGAATTRRRAAARPPAASRRRGRCPGRRAAARPSRWRRRSGPRGSGSSTSPASTGTRPPS